VYLIDSFLVYLVRSNVSFDPCLCPALHSQELNRNSTDRDDVQYFTLD
jgi:hypothetical protein